MSDPAPSLSTSSPSAKPARGGKGKLRGRPNDSPDVQLSKTLSYILRHGAEKEGLRMRKDGFIKLDDLLARPKLKGVDMPTIERIVAENAKQRFALATEEDAEGKEVVLIRANQGHSVQVEALELEPLTTVEQMPVVVHGTDRRHWQSIAKDGLKTMNRTHIHCAPGLLGEDSVISGMRASCTLYIYLDVAKCLDAGATFFRSANGVILTAGLSTSRSIPKELFAKAVTKDGEVVHPPASPQ